MSTANTAFTPATVCTQLPPCYTTPQTAAPQAAAPQQNQQPMWYTMTCRCPATVIHCNNEATQAAAPAAAPQNQPQWYTLTCQNYGCGHTHFRCAPAAATQAAAPQTAQTYTAYPGACASAQCYTVYHPHCGPGPGVQAQAPNNANITYYTLTCYNCHYNDAAAQPAAQAAAPPTGGAQGNLQWTVTWAPTCSNCQVQNAQTYTAYHGACASAQCYTVAGPHCGPGPGAY